VLSTSVTWQIGSTDEFHKDLAVGRNENKELFVCWLVWDFSFVFGWSESSKHWGSAARDLGPNGRWRSCCILLFGVCVRFLLSLQSENEKK
jgi:hypothetical protein